LRGWGRGISYPGPRDVWGPRRRSEIQKYIRMHHFEKKSSKFFYIEGPRKNVWGPRENVSPGLAVALDGPGQRECRPISCVLAVTNAK